MPLLKPLGTTAAGACPSVECPHTRLLRLILEHADILDVVTGGMSIEDPFRTPCRWLLLPVEDALLKELAEFDAAGEEFEAGHDAEQDDCDVENTHPEHVDQTGLGNASLWSDDEERTGDDEPDVTYPSRMANLPPEGQRVTVRVWRAEE